MANRVRIVSAILAAAFLSSAASAAEEQWLRYRTSAEPYRYDIAVKPQILEVLAEAPQGLKAPESAGFDARFARWKTPMAKNGVLLMLSRSKQDGAYDRLYVDTTGEGNFAGAAAIKPNKQSPDSTSVTFGPFRIALAGEDGAITYDALVYSSLRQGNVRVALASACWYEGQVTIDGKKYQCTLIDHNCNGTFNDSSIELHNCDYIKLGAGDKIPSRYMGKYLQVDGKLYHPEPARDGASIKFERAENVPMGTLVVSDEITFVSLAGPNGHMDFDLTNGTTQVPAGQWLLNRWRVDRKDSAGAKWTLTGASFPESTAFDIAEGQEKAIDVGEPVTVKVATIKSSDQIIVREVLAGKLGEDVTVELGGGTPPAPKLRIKNADGSYDKAFDFQYG